MKNLDTFKLFESYNKSYEKYIIDIINILDDKKIEYSDLTKGDSYLYAIINKHPFSWSFVGNDVTVIIEKGGITDTLGTYDINTELNDSIDTVLSRK